MMTAGLIFKQGAAMEKIKLLLVEDDEHFHNLLGALFAKINKRSKIQYTLDWVADAAKIEDNAFEDADAVLLDYKLGGETTGLDILKQAAEKGCRTPIIFLTGQGGREVFREARENGAAGYLIKQEIVKAPFTLEAVVHFAVENAQQRERLRQMATLDGLTGLLNHGEMQRRLDAEIARANRSGQPLSLILIDIDHFKQINDTHGHPAGDGVLKWLSEMLRKSCRKSDIIARYGGEEFLIILPETDEQRTAQKAETLRREIASQPFRGGGLSIPVTASFGVARLRVEDTKQILVGRVDELLYEAKHNGRNRVAAPGKTGPSPLEEKATKMGGKLLVVDDDPHMLDLYAAKLSGFGYDLVTAANGGEALEILNRESFDAVLLDQTMPDMNGVETLERLSKELVSIPPVIMISAADSRHLAVEFMKLPGAADFSAKPVNFELLDVQIKGALRTRTLQVTRDRERLARAAAEEINRLKDTFLSQMSHEFSNPLNVIQGFISLAEKDLEENNQTESLSGALAQIKTGAQELKFLVEELFHATKTEFGGERLDLFPVDIPGTLRNVISKFSTQAREKGLVLEEALDTPLPLILADPKRMTLMLTYLIDNAVKFTSKGSIRITAEETKGFLRIDIGDTGPGIAPKDQDRIFNRFTRINTAGHLPGAGMGLYLAKLWAEKMNGRIWVDSESGKGAVFHLAFPVWKDEEFEDLF
jgi:diguanylate cyclase (GGDEF)-like protein